MILLEREKMLSELEQKIGYSFRSRALLDRALTHRSFANERLGENCQHNEAMEFLGDSVLGFVVSAWLLERFPDLSEGKLSKMKAHLVSESRLVELAETLELGSYILLNRGEEKTGGRQKHALLADAYEALIGVLYVDGGIAVAEKFLRRELREKLSCIDPSSMIGADYKSALQEKLQAVGGPSPDYVVVEVLGPDHRRTFRVELRIGRSALSMGEGRTIKLAQQEAARVALESSDDLVTIAAEQRRSAASYESRGDRRVAVDVTADQEPLSRLAPEQNAGEGLTSARGEIAAHSKEAGEDFNRDTSLDISPEAETDREARSVTSDV
jgi:ribonuclease-3